MATMDISKDHFLVYVESMEGSERENFHPLQSLCSASDLKSLVNELKEKLGQGFLVPDKDGFFDFMSKPGMVRLGLSVMKGGQHVSGVDLSEIVDIIVKKFNHR